MNRAATQQAGEAAVAILAEARRSARRCDPFPEELRPKSEAEGYDLQTRVLKRLFGEGFTVGGYKVGMVSAEIRALWGGSPGMGIDWPLYGTIPETILFADGAELSVDEYFRIYVEGEFVVRMGRDVLPDRAPYDRQSIAEYVQDCMAGLEFVDMHADYRAYEPPTAPLIIADNGGNVGGAFGGPIPNWRHMDLAAISGSLTVDGKVVDGGRGAALQGHPFQVLAWLANHMLRQGRRLRRGDVVLLGAVTTTFGDFPPDSLVSFSWEGLSTASVRFRRAAPGRRAGATRDAGGDS